MGGTAGKTGGATTGGAPGGTVGNTGGAATGGTIGGTAGNTGGAATGGRTGGTSASSATGGATGGGRAGGTTASSATGGATGGGRAGGTAASSATGGTTAGGGAGGTAASGATGGTTGSGGISGTAGSGGASAVGGSTLIGGPGPASQTGFDWGKAVIDTEIAGKTTLGVTYPEGLKLHGIYKAYKRLNDPKYLTFLTASVDSWGATAFVSLDDLMHNLALADAYELTQKASYKTTADSVRRIYDTFPTTSDGAFWHANRTDRAHQLWGDGVFMSLSFLTRYATVFNDPTVYPIAITNLTVTATHLKNAATGLLWHAYDESGVATWSKTPSKTNEISWGRAMGWFTMACVMTLEMLPANDPSRAQIETILSDLIAALAKHQDPATGRWFQVVDMESDARNWTETSCSMMYSYVIWWAYQHGLVDASFADVAKKGFNGVMQKVTKDANNKTTIATTVTGLNASGAVADYFSHPTADNDQHGVGAFMLMWEGMQ